MSYQSRVYRQRNPQAHEESKNEPFFSNQHESKSSQNNSFFQAKLSVNQAGDSFEHEADQVANAVVNKSSQSPVVQQKKINGIQRLATPVDDEKLATNDERIKRDKDIQEKPLDSRDLEDDQKKNVQAKGDGNASGSAASSHLSSRIGASAGRGSQMPKHVLHEMNSSFGIDFSGVRIHNDRESVNMNKELQAQAFTHGKDIYFNEGKFNPENAQGKFLLAHELTHVVQQSGVEQESVQRSCNDGACESCPGGKRDFWITFYFRRKATQKTMTYLRQQINGAKTILGNCCLNLKADFNWTLLPGGGTFNFLNAHADGSWNYSADASALGSGNTFAGSNGIPVLVVDEVPASGGGVTVDRRFDTNYAGRTYAVIGVNQTNPNPGCNHLAHELWHVSSGIVGHDPLHGTLASCTGNAVSPEFCGGLRHIVEPVGDFPTPAPHSNTAVA